MEINNLDPRCRVVYSVHRCLHSFHPAKQGTAVGVEFEDFLRDRLVREIPFDLISSRRDLGMGQGLTTRSGLSHELDLITRLGSYLFVFELKHYADTQLNKEMVLVFNQKVIDYYLENYKVLSSLKIYRIFVTRASFVNETIRQFCALWGILMVDREFYSPPICEIILKGIRDEVESRPLSLTKWFNPDSFTNLEKRARVSSAKLWRDLGTVWDPQLRLPGRSFAGQEGMPPAYVTRRWVAQQQELSSQMVQLKEQFASWKQKKEPSANWNPGKEPSYA